MLKNKYSRLILINALVWAVLMIATALILKYVETDQRNFLIMIQIAGWITLHSNLRKIKLSCHNE